MPALLSTPISALAAHFGNSEMKWMTSIIVVTHLHDDRPTPRECLEIALYLCDQGFEEALNFLWELHNCSENSWDEPFDFLDDGHHYFVYDQTFRPIESNHHVETDTPDLIVCSYKEGGRPCTAIRFPFTTEKQVFKAIEQIHGVWESFRGSPLMNQDPPPPMNSSTLS